MDDLRTLEFIYWHWFVLAAILGTIEVIIPATFFLWLGISAFLTGAVVFMVPALNAPGQIVLFCALAIASVLMAWKFFKKNPIASEQPLLNQRAAQYVGKVYALDGAIVGGTGRIKIADSSWKVEGPDAPEGASVRVTGFDGSILKVEMAGLSAQHLGHKPVEHAPNLAESLKDPLDRKE